MRHTIPLLTLAAFGVREVAANFQCDNIVEDGVKFDLSPLGGVHSIYEIVDEGGESLTNTTYAFDLCKRIEDDSDMPRSDQCEHGTWVCATERLHVKEGDQPDRIITHWSIAGDFRVTGGGGALDPKYKRISKLDSNPDPDKDGLLITLNGGHRQNGKGKMKQRAIFELICDRDRTGLETDSFTSQIVYEKRDENEGEGDGDGEGSAPDDDQKGPLRFNSYTIKIPEGEKEEFGVLRATWYTKYACEGEAGKDHSQDPGVDQSASWGFFTWFIIILFLGIAAYLIFGSWLNYNRHGARGWDLLPHSDTIRDIPYIVRDLGRRVVSTVQGGGRGGYNQI